MKQLFIILTIIVSIATYSCGNGNTNTTGDSSNASSNNSAATSETNSAVNKNDETSSPLLDTGKLKSDMNDMLTSIVSGKPDTTKLKNAASDIMTTDAKILSDSGIDKMYGNSNDPAVKAAANSLKKMRNGMGLTPGKLDSMKKEAKKLRSNQ